MYVSGADAETLRKGFVDAIRARWEETNEFLAKLAEEDDWSFVIKSHALIEAAVTDLITSVLGDERIRPSIERLPLSESQMGKVAFAKQLGLLDKPKLKFIRWYSELRNDLVHKVENVNFKFSAYWASLDKAQKKSWKDTIQWGGEPTAAFGDLVEKQPKTALWLSILSLIAICETDASQARMKRDLDSASEKATTDYLKHQEERIRLQSNLIDALTEMADLAAIKTKKKADTRQPRDPNRCQNRDGASQQ